MTSTYRCIEGIGLAYVCLKKMETDAISTICIKWPIGSMKTEKRIALSTEPWGTPQCISVEAEFSNIKVERSV